ncbi:MAG: ATP-binding cassette domain-containing protein, partial [Raoultibacter sp.]
MASIEIHNVRKSFKKTEVLHGVSLAVSKGQIVGLVGPSGCGKTTLVDLIVGNTIPTSGTVKLSGEQAPYPTARKRLGYMPQETALYEDITADENLQFFGALYGIT